MCGVTGFLGGIWPDGEAGAVARVRAMSDAVTHRGPDSSGEFVDLDARIALGHRRLSILDISPAGHQPMVSSSARFVVSFNGEIYNHRDLRAELDRRGHGIAYRGHSDTETLTAGFDAWGIRATVERCVGMFAFAVWDRKSRTLTLARDRVGEKPLYYGVQGRGIGRTFLFGSELSALRRHPSFHADVSRNALCLYLRQMSVPGTFSIYEGIHKLAPGTILEVGLESMEPRIHAYWSAAHAAADGVANPFRGTELEAVDELEALLRRTVASQMAADVPLGAFLSGGVDSSTLVALMQSQSTRRVKTFSIGFTSDPYNEARHAKSVASCLGTDHTEFYVTPENAMDSVASMSRIYDEPFADSSQIPTYAVSALARQHVTVSLSGDGGDEVFGGYNRYQFVERFWPRLSRVPRALRRVAAWPITHVSPGALDRVASIVPGGTDWSMLGDKLRKSAIAMTSRDATELYRKMISAFQDPERAVLGGHEPTTVLTAPVAALESLSIPERIMALDLISYLPDDILVKVDRAAMAVSLETRAPYLDHRVAEFAWRLPLSMKLHSENGHVTTKWALRQVLYRYVPESLVERPKMGFSVPVDAWLRGPLRDWAGALLEQKTLREDGYFDVSVISKKWDEHQRGEHNWQNQLWCVLMFQEWLRATRA